jgi:oligogalacturonide lyase
MKKNIYIPFILLIIICSYQPAHSQLGKVFPSEKKIIKDPVTGNDLVFLTSAPNGDRKIYPTHNQWTSDGKWIIFRSGKVKGEALAVNEQSGKMVQVTEGGFRGMLCVARKSMKLYYMREAREHEKNGSMEIMEVDLEPLFANGLAGQAQEKSFYLRNCGTIPVEFQAGGDMTLDGGEEWIWFRVGKEEAAKHLPEETVLEPDFGPRRMGAGPGGIAGMNIKTGEIKYVVSVPFQVGHIQTNPWAPGQIVFCWETGGKSPQRTWVVQSDGTGRRPLYPESPYEWVTHEAVITPDEAAFAIMGHRKITRDDNNQTSQDEMNKRTNPGQEREWGDCGTREKPTGLSVINIKTGEMMIAGQIPYGSGFWHVTGSPDGRFLAGDNFSREIYLIDRNTHEMVLISAGHKRTAADHPHPTFSPDGTKILIQSAMLSEDDRSMNICVIPVPEQMLNRDL